MGKAFRALAWPFRKFRGYMWRTIEEKRDDVNRDNPSAENLPEPFRSRLKSMYAGEPQQGSGGPVEINKQVRIEESAGMWLYDLCLNLKPKRTLEVGMAYGFQRTLYILAAIERLGAGHHTAIDPWQEELWHNVGLLNTCAVGMVRHFDLILERSASALGRIGAEGNKFDLIYIDGDHRFDGTLVDFTLAAELCPIGGSIVLDDPWMPAVRSVLSWIRSNRRDFEEIAVAENFAHFRRIREDERAWDHFVDFDSVQGRIARRINKLLK